MRNGKMKMMKRLTFPAVIGRDGSGVVEKIGSSVKNFKVGDSVAGFFAKNHGTYAEYSVFEEDEIVTYPKDVMTPEEASAFPLVGCTVLEMMRKHPLVGEVLDREAESSFKTNVISEPRKDVKNLKVLVVGASGGTGQVACIIAKQFLSRYFNVKVYAVCSEKNAELVRKVGADVVIDYNKTSAKAGAHTTHSKGGLADSMKSICQVIRDEHHDDYVDLVLDCVGGYYYYNDVHQHFDCRRAENGVVYSTISAPNPNDYELTLGSLLTMGSYIATNKLRSLSSSSPSFYQIFVKKNTRDLHLLMNNIVTRENAHKNLPLLQYPLSNLKEAHLQMESQRTVGKIILNIAKRMK